MKTNVGLQNTIAKILKISILIHGILSLGGSGKNEILLNNNQECTLGMIICHYIPWYHIHNTFSLLPNVLEQFSAHALVLFRPFSLKIARKLKVYLKLISSCDQTIAYSITKFVHDLLHRLLLYSHTLNFS